MNTIRTSMWFDETKAIEAFRTGRGVAWGDHDDRLFCGVAAFYRNAYRGSLVPEWLPALNGVVERLEAGINVADIGCGHGHSTLLMADAFPRSRFHGFDAHAASIAKARRLADEAATKLIGLALRKLTQRWKNPPSAWAAAKAQFAIQFGERFTLDD